MQRQEIPPQPLQNFIKKAKGVQDLWNLLFLGLVSGVIGGYTGYIVAQTLSLSSLIIPSDDTLPHNVDVNGQDIPLTPILQNDPIKELGVAEKETQSILLQLRTTVVGIYKKKTSPPSTKLQDVAYLPSEILGLGVTLTSDGWLLSTKDVLSERKLEDIAVVMNSTIFTPIKHITDEATGIVFLKIPTVNLPVVTLTNEDALLFGQTLFTLDAWKNVNTVSLNSKQYRDIQQPSDLIESSERLDTSFLILQGTPISSPPLGLPVFTQNGTLIGLVASVAANDQGLKVVPVAYIQNILKGVFQQEKIVRPFLGVEYINLDSLIVTEQTLEQFQIPITSKRGAFILDIKARLLTDHISGDELYPAWLKSNDIIFKVNEEAVSSEFPLSTLIQQYQPGDTIKLLIWREGKEIEVPGTLSGL